MIDRDEDWLRAELKAQGYGDIGAIFLAEYDRGQLNIVGYGA